MTNTLRGVGPGRIVRLLKWGKRGLQIVNAHMKRALGAVTTWDTFRKMTEGDTSAVEDMVRGAAGAGGEGKVHVAAHVQEAVQKQEPLTLPHPTKDVTAAKDEAVEDPDVD